MRSMASIAAGLDPYSHGAVYSWEAIRFLTKQLPRSVRAQVLRLKSTANTDCYVLFGEYLSAYYSVDCEMYMGQRRWH
jgi:hypothetical protein